MRADEHENMHRVETRHFWFVGTRRVIMAVLDRFLGRERLGRARVLDLGCGTGFTLTQLPQGTRRVGLDFSRAALSLASRRAPDASLLRASAYSLPFADRSFEAVLALDVIEHLDDDVAAAREIARVLHPEGVAVITVPAFQELWSAHDEALDHKRRYRLSQIRDVLERAGLRIEHATYYNFFLFPAIAAARLLDRARQAIDPSRVPSTELKVPFSPLNFALTEVLALERAIAPRVRLPIGVSCLLVARRERA